MTRYFKRYMLDSVIEKFNAVFSGPGVMKWDYQKDHGYNIWLGEVDVYDGLSLRGAVKAVQMAIAVSEDINVLITKLAEGNTKFWRDRVTVLEEANQKFSEALVIAEKRVPFPAEITKVLDSGVIGDVVKSLKWGVEVAFGSLNHGASEFIKIHPFDGQMFATLYNQATTSGDKPYFGYTYDEAREIQGVLRHRYWRTIQVALLIGPYK